MLLFFSIGAFLRQARKQIHSKPGRGAVVSGKRKAATSTEAGSGAAVSLDDTMPTRQLSAAEENEARKAFAMLQNKKLLTVNKRGRPASMAPVHAALAIRKGAFAKNRGASLSAESQLTAAATAYGGVPAKKIKEYLDLLVQCEAAAAAAVEAAEEAAVKAAVEAGKEVRLEAATAAKLQGKPRLAAGKQSADRRQHAAPLLS